MLPKPLRAALGSLPKPNADRVGGHLAASARLLGEDPGLAAAHARAARDGARRIGAVREAVGLTLYELGLFSEALPELRSARRMSGREDLVPVIADCERGVGAPAKALDVLADVSIGVLPPEAQVEAAIVASGAHRDLGDAPAAVALLTPVVERSPRGADWRARLLYAYADALLDAGRAGPALEAFRSAAEADVDGETDAADRVVELAGPAA